MPIADHIDTQDPEKLMGLLRRDDYPSFIKTLRTSADSYLFRVHDPQNMVVARSRAFASREARDRAYEEFLDFVEIEIHNRRQRKLFF
jgi:hypothetical protein